MHGHLFGALAGLLAADLATDNAVAGEITFTSWGGSYARAQFDTAVKPFSSQSGTVVKMEEYAGGLDEMRRQVGAGRVQWDVVDLTIDDALRACDDGLLEKIDPDKLAPGVQSEPARKDYLPGTLTDCVAGTIVYPLSSPSTPRATLTSARSPLPTCSTPPAFPASAACGARPRATWNGR